MDHFKKGLPYINISKNGQAFYHTRRLFDEKDHIYGTVVEMSKPRLRNTQINKIKGLLFEPRCLLLAKIDLGVNV